jgi:hypothetical protein
VSEVRIASVVLPPSDETCYAGHCSQTPCCDLIVRSDEQDPENAVGEEDVYAFSLCAAHALWMLHGVLELAVEKFPPDEAVDPPWEQDE